jgi:rare lipoprotein A
MRLSVNRGFPLVALIFLAACGGGSTRADLAAPAPTSGPGADYPVVLGPAFTIEGVTYTPADKLNFDQVGYAVAGGEGGEGVSIAHRTLPLPSYVEVTALDTGRTILARAQRRGPMTGTAMVELSPGAVAQLGIDPAGRAPVRIRRVNPPEIERAMLRRGGRVPNRMDTPKSLVAVLRRKLDGPSPGPLSAPTRPTTLAEIAAAPRPSLATAPRALPVPVADPQARGTTRVQVGAFASKANAEATAAKVGGKVERSGNLWLVRMGPYLARAEVAAALAKARGAGYSDARIQRVD